MKLEDFAINQFINVMANADLDIGKISLRESLLELGIQNVPIHLDKFWEEGCNICAALDFTRPEDTTLFSYLYFSENRKEDLMFTWDTKDLEKVYMVYSFANPSMYGYAQLPSSFYKFKKDDPITFHELIKLKRK